MDIILLSKLSGDRSVGIYSVAYKVAFALQFVALAFSASIYPAFCNYFTHSREKLSQLFEKSMYWLIVLAMPLSLGLIAIADKVVVPIFGAQYFESILPLQILMASLLFIFICFPIGALLNASNRQTRNTINLGIVAAANTILNIFLIPVLDYNGAAIANLISYLLLFVLGIVLVGKVVDYDKKFLLLSLAKIIFACVIMYLAVIFLKNYLNFIVVIIIAMAIYAGLAYLLKIISPGSIREFAGNFFNKKSLPINDVQP
jgi:O-antigen/teichoic acid export membrane protein